MQTRKKHPRSASPRPCWTGPWSGGTTTCLRKRRFSLLLLILPILPHGGAYGQDAFVSDDSPSGHEDILKEIRELRSLVGELQRVAIAQQKTIDMLKQGHQEDTTTQPASPRPPARPSRHHHGEMDHHATTEFEFDFPEKLRLNLENGHHIDISTVLDFTFFRTDDRNAEDRSKFNLRELEIAFQGQITDRVRVDLFITKPSDEEFEVEEGYFTFKLPYGFIAKAGKYRLPFGKLNTVHEPERPFVDLPLPLLNFLGGEQLNDSGVTVGRLIPNPWEHQIGLSFTVSSADNDVSFNGRSSSNPLLSARLYDLFALGEFSDLEIGVNFATGANDERGNRRTTLGLLDLTYRYKPNYAPEYDHPARFMWLTEAIVNAREGRRTDTDSFGIYSLLDYQFRAGWHAGLRFDYSQFPDSTDSEQSISAILTWFFTRHSRVRIQYQYLDPSTGDSDQRLWVQAVLILGAHEHPKLLGAFE